MAWADTLLDASFRGVTFDCMRAVDSAQRDSASHEYPYLDGADVEDLGRKARRITMSAAFFGKDYENRLQSFLKVLDEPGHGELIHPVFGSIKEAQLLSYEIGHDADSPDYCTVELAFVEATPGNPFFVQQLPVQKAEAVSMLAETARFNGIDVFASAISALSGVTGSLSRLNALRDVMTGTLGAIRSQLQSIIGTTLDLIDYPRAFASDVVSLVSGMADLRSFDAGVIMSDWKSLTGQLNNVVQLPGAVASGSADTAGSGGESGGSVGAEAKPIPAKAEDVALLTAVVQTTVATTLAEVAGQILAAEAEKPTLSPPEIERIANDVRDSIQQAIETHRQLFPVEVFRPVTEALKDTALGTQDAASAVIEALPPLITRTVEAPGNLHLAAFRWYGDYTRAQELARLNPHLINPNALQVGDVLNAYAR
ncbi:DNA circularization protein [Chromobacterium aquaticum]|uniref:DNA circularization protein n=1 Tax=Chromobacterium aquaticum TaxID=467180 RepID=A0ABV8ZYE8_9NEIS|nr:DNA circularization N-terminal domain-containing protein [Chromobacterium aquaticum]MCD5362804.1 DNA circularization N-terminal domain-containing protein [Chromobacterium aquaticum]